jgi:energy-coupling factor transporter ATP-binding protein EcfA2
MKTGVEKITIQNFKAFRNAKSFPLKGNHLLVYGPNGSGKSSLYFSLYTILQCDTKPLNKIKRYFDSAEDENLLNVHEPKRKSSFIKLTLTNNKKKIFTLSKNGLSPNDKKERTSLSEMNLASEFISHRLLINFYNFRNSKEIDLYPVFDRDIFPFIQPDGKRILFNDIIGDISERGQKGISANRFTKWKEDIATLDADLKTLIKYIDKYATVFLHDNFQFKDLNIVLKVKQGFSFRRVGKTNQYELVPPFIKLSVQKIQSNGKLKPIERPQSFLNESKLTAIALSVRFTILERRPPSNIKILALDDMLISLDMSNRMDVLNLIFKLYENKFQLMFFTHDKSFFREIKRMIENRIGNWHIYQFDLLKNDELSYDIDKSEIYKARLFLENHEFERCALELRKLGEIIFRNFLDKKKPEIFKTKEYVSFGSMIDTARNVITESVLLKFQTSILELELTKPELKLIFQDDISAFKKDKTVDIELKKKVLGARNSLFEIAAKTNKEYIEAFKFVKEVKKIKDRILNYGAHPSDEDLFKTEMEEAVKLFEKLQSVLNKV